MNACLKWVNASLVSEVKKSDPEDAHLDLVIFEVSLAEQFFFPLPITPSVLPAEVFSIEINRAAILLKP